MRLIDIEDISLLKTVSDGGLSAKALWRRICNQPTVDAVPVEWIKMRIKGLRGQLANADEDDKDLIWDLRSKIDELSGIAEYWRKEHETD